MKKKQIALNTIKSIDYKLYSFYVELVDGKGYYAVNVEFNHIEGIATLLMYPQINGVLCASLKK